MLHSNKDEHRVDKKWTYEGKGKERRNKLVVYSVFLLECAKR